MNEFIQENAAYFLITFALLDLFLILAVALALLKINKLNQKNKKFFAGKKAKDLEEIILKQIKSIDKNKQDIKELFDAYEKIYKIASKGVQKIGLIRYNPFGDVGGKQSFALALLDREDSGVIVSSLQTRQGLRLFVKMIIKKQCPDYPLTDEENEAIKNAKVTKGEKRV